MKKSESESFEETLDFTLKLFCNANKMLIHKILIIFFNQL